MLIRLHAPPALRFKTNSSHRLRVSLLRSLIRTQTLLKIATMSTIMRIQSRSYGNRPTGFHTKTKVLNILVSQHWPLSPKEKHISPSFSQSFPFSAKKSCRIINIWCFIFRCGRKEHLPVNSSETFTLAYIHSQQCRQAQKQTLRKIFIFLWHGQEF